jgi:hypothetical protein
MIIDAVMIPKDEGASFAAGAPIQAHLHPGLGHGGAANGSLPDSLPFVRQPSQVAGSAGARKFRRLTRTECSAG